MRPALLAPMDSIIKDVIFAVRTLRKNLGFTVVAVLMIALGIGACASIFSVVNAVLLQPLPYADPSRLVLVWTELRARNVMDFPFPIPDVKDLRDKAKTLEGVAGLFAPGRTPIAGDDGQPEQVRAIGVTSNIFSLLGARMQLGRDFIDDDATPQPPPPPQAPGAAAPNGPPPNRLPTSAILSYAFWQRRYGGDPSIVGKTIDLGGNRTQIVGVLKPGFELLFPARTGIDSNIDVWTALRLNFETAQRNTGALRVIARLKPGATLQSAQAEAEGIAAEMRALYPRKKDADVHFRVVPMQEDIVSESRPSILALFGAVFFVLLIACSNVANLLVVHAAARRRELVIRAAIGCSRTRLVRQMLTESVILALAGAGLGLFLAQLGIEGLLSLAPAKLPRISAIAIDPIVIAFTIAISLLTIVIFGVIPAFRASNPNIIDVLRISGGSPGLRAGRLLRSAVVVTELALSFVLLIGFGLMFRSFIALQRVDAGYDANNVLTFTLQAPQRGQEARAAFLQQVTDRIAAIPDVQSVSASTPVPLDGSVQNIPWATEEAAADPAAFRQANFFTVRPGYFETLKTRLIVGRTFTAEDNNPNTNKVVIDDLLAAKAFQNKPAVGQTLLVRNLRLIGPNPPANEKVEVVGVVHHQRHESLTSEGREEIFFVEQYLGAGAAGRWIVRTKGKPEAIGNAVKAAVGAIDPKIPLGEVQPMSAFVDKSMGPTRFAMLLIAVFAGIAGLMAAVGLYGVLATVVRQRTAEIGMRIVFGATRPRILRLIVGEGLRLSALGIVAGLAVAFALTGVIRSMLVTVTPTDPVTFGLITIVFVIIAIVASFVPACRASRLDPNVALREE